MKLAHLIPRNAMRHRLRSVLTVVGLALAILTFAVVRTLITAWYSAADAASPNRLVVRNAISLTFPLPLAYAGKIEQVPGVDGVSWGNWFGGVYKDPKNFFAQFGVDFDSYFDLYPEIVAPPDQLAQAKRERNAAVVGRKLAEKHGWKLGDIVPITGTIFAGEYEFVVRAIYDGAKPNTDESTFYFHWRYLDERVRETMPDAASKVGFYIVRIDDPSRAASISGEIDERFENSLAATLSETEEAFQLGFVEMSGAIIGGIRIASVLVIGVVLLVLANTMAMAARERTKEYAVLKTLGFRGGDLAVLVAGESLLLALAGGAIALALLRPLVSALSKPLSDFFPVLEIAPSTFWACGAIALGVGVAAAVLPARHGASVRIVDGLRRIG